MLKVTTDLFPTSKSIYLKEDYKKFVFWTIKKLVVNRCTTAVIIVYYFIFNVFHIEFKSDLPVEVKLVFSVFRLKTIVFAPS